MDLKSFITETLVQIVDGVEEARQKIAAGPTNAQINPAMRYCEEQKLGDVRPVEFDVAVTAAKEGGAGGKLAISVAALNFGVEGGGKLSTETVSRIKFTVDLAQPADVQARKKPAPIDYNRGGSSGLL